MSTQRKPEFVEDGVSEEAVHHYLENNPDFFERHGGLLNSLRLPHVTGGTVSLVERQVSMLRQRDLKLERKLKDLLEVARANDALAAKIHELALGLLALQAFNTFLQGSGPRCGQIRDAQRAFLFGQETDEVGSTALIRLGRKSEVGFLAIGSVDRDRFHPGMSIDFLTRLGELITEALRRF